MSLDSTLGPTSAESLRGLCGGRVHLPGDAGYDAARTPWNLAVDQRPAAVAVPHTVDEVVEVVRAATEAGLRVAPQSSGHNAAPLAELGLAETVLVRLHEMTGVSVDPAARVARVVGGTLWQEVVEACAPHGLAAMHGSSPDVAVAGYVLGGGLSWYARRHGLATNHVVAIEVVTADGRVRRADADHERELFWALRGGGGNLGVVVAVELALLPITDAYAGMLMWDRVRSPEVARAWASWTRDLPESVTTSMRVLSLPPLPELPPFLSGRNLVVIDGAVLEDDERAAELLAPLRALDPEMDTFARMPAAALPEIHMDPPGPTPAVSGHAMLAVLEEETIEAMLNQVGPGRTTSLLFAELRHLGGALARPADGGGALDHVPDPYAMFCVAIAPVPEAAAAGVAEADQLVAALRPWSSGRRFLNFTERAVDAGTAFTPDAWERLLRVRRVVDPTGVFVANHAIS
jgi:FAD/FMN-containing dehydrogenase